MSSVEGERVCAGTPLGDPIEVGALTAVLTAAQSSHQTPSLTLLASKSWIGHSEPAAGAVGMVHLCRAFAQQAALPVMHLRALNPHIHPMLQPGKATDRGAHIPRQAGGLIGRGLPFHAGVSAFAFQGTNAHVIMSSASSDSTDSPLNSVQFQQQRHWIAPLAHALLMTAEAAKGVMTFHADLGTPASAFLLDHVVSEQSLLPATAFLELAYSSARLSLTAQVSSNLSLLDTTLVAPLQLAQPQASRASLSGVVTVQLATTTAALSVFSHNTSQHQYHAFASVAAWSSPARHTGALSAATNTMLSAVFSMNSAEGVPQSIAGAPSAVGSLALPISSTDAFNMHPAVADSALHLVTSFETSPDSTNLRVPVKLQAMHVPVATPSLPALWTCAAPSLETLGLNRTHTFGLINSAGGAQVALRGLTLQPFTRATPSAAQQSQASAERDCLYELSWPADMVQDHTMHQATATLKHPVCSMQTTIAAISRLQTLDQQLGQRQVLSAAAGLVLPAAGRPAELSIVAAAQASLMRAAAQELTDCHVTCQTVDVRLPSSANSTGIYVSGVFMHVLMTQECVI